MAADEKQIRVLIDTESSTAEMVAPADFPRAMLSEEFCVGALRQFDVAVTPEVAANVRRFLENLPPDGQEARAVVARGRPPIHGEDGAIEWLVGDGEPESDEDPNISYYERRAYVTVAAGQVIAQAHEPTAGQDGVDVRGKAISARAGKAVNLQLDDSVSRDAAGRLVAQRDGILRREGDKVAVAEHLEIDGHVDFSTGNITFNGDVVIKKGVRDCFVVKATGNVRVQGLIEAAVIECEGDLHASGGFAGRERGRARVGRDLHGKYFDNVEADVRGNMFSQREIINCDMTIHGQLQSPQASVIGGRLTLVGAGAIATAGSDGNVETHLILGTVPRLEPFLAELDQLAAALEARAQKLQADLTQLQEHTKRRATAADKQRLAELNGGLTIAQEQLTRARAALEAVHKQVRSYHTVDLTIGRMLHPGVIVSIGRRSFTITEPIKGPVRIHESLRGEVLYKVGDGEARPLSQLADLSARAA